MSSVEIQSLQRQLGERDAELAALRAYSGRLEAALPRSLTTTRGTPHPSGTHTASHEGRALMTNVPTHRAPTSPGEMLLEEFLEPMGLTQKEFAQRIGVTFQRVNAIVNGRRGISADTALRFARFFGNTAAFWMNLQLMTDLYYAQKDAGKEINRIQPYQAEAV